MNEIDFQLSDGRNLHLLVGEQFDGPTVIFHHGTPAYAGTWRKTIAQLESEGSAPLPTPELVTSLAIEKWVVALLMYLMISEKC